MKLIQVISSYSAGQNADLARFTVVSIDKAVTNAFKVGKAHHFADVRACHTMRVSAHDVADRVIALNMDATTDEIIANVLRHLKGKGVWRVQLVAVGVTVNLYPSYVQ